MQLLLHILDSRRVDVPSVRPPELGAAAADDCALYLRPPERLLPARREVSQRNMG